MDILPEDKILECKALFNKFDKDGNGHITTKELEKILKELLGYDPSPQELKEMIDSVDVDGSGKVEFEEFLELFAAKMRDPSAEADLMEAFKILDPFNHGTIPYLELKTILTTCSVRLTDLEAEQLLKEADEDNDGEITYSEFIKVILGNN